MLRFRLLIASFGLWVAVVLPSPASAAAEAPDLYLIDAHSQADSTQALQKVIPLMDQAGVRLTILAARDNLPSGEVAKYADQHPGRIMASVRTKSRAYQDNAPGYYKTLERDVASGRFGAISELLMYHAKKGERAPEVVVYPSDNRVQAALTLAKQKGWPLVVHIEFASLSEQAKSEYMKQLEAMLGRDPSHPFVMIHMGQLRADEVRRLIEAHKNVYFLTSHANPVVISGSNQPWTQMFEGDVLAPDWQALMVQYPDRFVLALDNVWPEHWSDYYLRQIEYWRKALAALPREVADAVAHGNAERLWRIPKR